jgi:glycosyltransferase involved in cell wall biosynthesis
VTRAPGSRPVMHVITALTMGGAEMSLYRLLSALSAQEFPATVVALMAEGPLIPRIEGLGVPVLTLGMRRALPNPAAAWRLQRIIRRACPAIIQGWMYHGNLAAWVGRILAQAPACLAVNIRQTVYDLRRERPGTRVAIRLGALVSSRAEMVVYNSHVARRQHESLGYSPARAQVIPNGFDCEQFRPRPEAGARLRSELGIPAKRSLVGLVARYHPMKGHVLFFEAARRILDAGHDVAFICAGRGVAVSNPDLAGPISRLGIGDRVHLLWEREDTPDLFAAFDVACSSSEWGEGFPNAVGEALAAGTPCVVTNVGDSASVLGPGGIVVEAGSATALAGALVDLLGRPAPVRREIGALGRAHIQTHFSLARVADLYADLYRALPAPGQARTLAVDSMWRGD